MKIAIFTNNYLPNPYGVSMSIETFRKDFERLGHQVFIFAPKFPGYSDKNPHVFRYPSIDINIKFRFPLPIPYSWKIRRILKKLDIDIIHAQHPNLLGSAAARWARKKKIPLIFTWHTLYDKYTNFIPFLPKKIASGYIIKKAVNFANKTYAVVVPTDSIIPILKKWGVTNKKICPIATGVEEAEFADPKGEAVREKYGIAPDEILLFTMSRLTEEKNVEFVIRAAEKILKNNDKIRLLISGEGYLLPKLKRICETLGISEKVIFSGLVPRDEVKDYYAAASIFIYGSESETQGMTLMEAMYVGLPIVAVDATGSKSLVLNNGNGFLVREDGKEFADAILKLVQDKNLRESFGEVSKRIARTKFTSQVCARRMIELYREAIENHSR